MKRAKFIVCKLSTNNTELELCEFLAVKWLLPDDKIPCLSLGGLLLADVLIVLCLSSDTFVVKFLITCVRVSISLASFSLPLLAAARGFLFASLESFIGSSSLMTTIMCRSFSTAIDSLQFYSNVGFLACLMNYNVVW